MLASKFRITKRSDFAKVKSLGDVQQSDSFGLAVFRRGDGLPARFGFVVSTKISKKSTERNRVRRIFNEAVRINIEKVLPGLEVIFLAKPLVLTKTKEEIDGEVEAVFSKAGLFK